MIVFLLLSVRSVDKIFMKTTKGKIVCSPPPLPLMMPVSEELLLDIFVGVKLHNCYITEGCSNHQCFVSILLG